MSINEVELYIFYRRIIGRWIKMKYNGIYYENVNMKYMICVLIEKVNNDDYLKVRKVSYVLGRI